MVFFMKIYLFSFIIIVAISAWIVRIRQISRLFIILCFIGYIIGLFSSVFFF